MTRPQPNFCLYYAPDNASFAVRLTLEMFGYHYRTYLVDRKASAQKSDTFLALNPNGLIPVLEIDGAPISETGAILLTLADLHQPMRDPVALRWLFWLANTLHVTERMMFYPKNYCPDHPHDLRGQMHHILKSQLNLLADNLPSEFLDHPNILANYLLPLLRWPALYGGADDFTLANYPRLLKFAKLFETFDYVITASNAEGLGKTPFSNPSLPQPPEGSAT